KTAYMHINPSTLLQTGDNIAKVEKYKYLGVWLYSNGSSDKLYKSLFSIGKKLEKLDKENVSNEQKYKCVVSELVPLLRKKFRIMYDVSVEDKKKVLMMCNKYIDKWAPENNKDQDKDKDKDKDKDN